MDVDGDGVGFAPAGQQPSGPLVLEAAVGRGGAADGSSKGEQQEGDDGQAANEAEAAAAASDPAVTTTSGDEEGSEDEDEEESSDDSEEEEEGQGGGMGLLQPEGEEEVVDDLAMVALAAGLDGVVCGAPTGIAADEDGGGVGGPASVPLPLPEVVEEGATGPAAGRLLEIAREIERVRVCRHVCTCV